jgi:hypothetical protein
VPEPIKVWSHHEVVSWVKSNVESGIFKHCAHLTVITLKQPASGRSYTEVFVPDCKRRSFEWVRYPPMDRQFEFEMLTSALHTNLIRCPKNCVNYVSQRRASMFRPVSRLWSLRRYVAVPFQWFAKLPWQTQLAVIVLGIFLLAPQWIPLLIKLVTVYRGQPAAAK